MGDPIKAQRTAKHFAVVVSPELAATPFGSRQIPSIPAVSFQISELIANRTYGNSSNLFLERSIAIDKGLIFKPIEFLPNNAVEGGFSTSHGHMGVISGVNITPCPGAINCGVLTGPKAECSAELEGLLDALAERMANEFMAAPFGFLSDFASARNQAVKDMVEQKAGGYWESIKSGAGAVADAASNSWDYVSENDLATIAGDAGAGVVGAYDGAVAMTTDAMEAIAELSDLTFEDLKTILKEWLRSMLDDIACSAQGILASMLADPKPMAAQLGEAVGAAQVHLAETAAVVLVTRGAGGAASKLGQLMGKAGNRMGDLYGTLKDAARKRRENPADGPITKPDGQRDGNPSSPPLIKKDADTDKKPEEEADKDAVEGEANGKPNDPCFCERKGSPVSTIKGIKILDGDNDLDFVLKAPLPLVWQRTYTSHNARQGLLGQGWALPIDFCLEVEDNALIFVDAQDRRTRFPHLAVGQSFFSKYEHNSLKRTHRNQYEVISPDGLRLIFGLGPLDQARLGQRDTDEAKQTERELREWERLVTRRAAQGEEPLPERQADPRDKRLPQADSLVLLGFIDPNHNHLRLHYEADGLPRHLDTSSGRRIGFVFDRGRPKQPRLTHVVELLGQPDAQGHYPREQQQWLVEYRYSGEGDLLEVRDGDGQLGRTFAWQNHMMVEHAEPGGLVSRYEWDQLTPKGRVLKNSLSTGQYWLFDYHSAERFTRVTEAEGRVTTYHYDEDHQLVRLIDPAGGETRHVLDPYGNRLTSTDPAGRTTRYLYDARGNLIRITQPDGAVYQLAYHDLWRKPVAITDPLQRTTRYRYDERGNLVEITETDGTSTEYRLDARGLPKALVDARGGLKIFDFDAAGRLLAHTDCSGNRTQYSYDSRGRLASVTDALGQNSQYGYQRINRRDRLSTLRHADGAIERFAYDPLGRLIAHHDPLGQVTRYQLDAQGRPLERIDALGHRLRYQYDLHGRLTTLHNENNAVYRFGWDVLDRLVAEQGFDGRRIDYRYDRAGNLIESADGVPVGAPLLGRGVDAPLLRTRYQRDAMGRLLDKFSSKPGVTMQDGRPPIVHSRFAYDAAGQLVRARNGQARVELYYNPVGQLSREVLRSRGGLSSELRHAYDPLGNRESTTLPDGRVLNTLRYGSGHVHQINLDFQVICDFERDALHREVGRSQGLLSSRYERDPLGRLLQSQVQAQAQASEPLVGETERDKASQGQRIARRYQYDLGGQLKSITDRRQGTTQYGYDALGRLLAASAPHAQETFAFDPAHNLMQADEARQQEARLQKTTWSEAEWAAYVQANLDNPAFNPLLTPAEAAADPSTWGESKPNRLRIWEEHRYAYDAWGNCVEKKSGPHSVRTFEWDAEHQLSRATVIRQQGRFLHREYWGYDYDPFGRRIAKYRLDPTHPERSRPWLDSGTTHFSWDGNRLLLERQGDKQTLYLYEPQSFVPLALVRSEEKPPEKAEQEAFPLPQEWLAFKDSHPEQWDATVGAAQRKFDAKHKRDKQAKLEQPKSPAEVFYVHTDHLGTPRELTDSAGHIVWAAAYKAWGSTAKIERPGRLVTHTVGNTQTQRWEEQADPIEQHLRFQGQYFDLETGLHYNRFRYYDPDCGRFVSQDPIGLAGGVNNYQYAPNPVEWVDPLGLSGRQEPTPWIPPGNAKEGWQHIDERHISGTNTKNGQGDLFEPGTTQAQIQCVCEILVKNGVRVSDPNKTIQTYEKKVIVNGRRDRVRGIFDSKDGNRTITVFPVRSE